MNLAPLHLLALSPAKPLTPPFQLQNLTSCLSRRFIAYRYPVKNCISKEKAASNASSKGFSILSQDVPWDVGSSWSTMAVYFLTLHVPLSFGGLSMVAQSLHQTDLNPQTKAVSLLIIQTVEFCGVWALLQHTAKPKSKLIYFFLGKKHVEERNWIQAAALGSSFLILLVLLTSLLADRLIATKDVNNLALKEILSNSSAAKAACFAVFCFITPLLEEIIYRGFLLASLASTMEWQWAVILSSFVFSAAHLSWENAPQLFIIGCVLGSSYCWSGNLVSSFTIHLLYNALTLVVTMLN